MSLEVTAVSPVEEGSSIFTGPKTESPRMEEKTVKDLRSKQKTAIKIPVQVKIRVIGSKKKLFSKLQ